MHTLDRSLLEAVVLNCSDSIIITDPGQTDNPIVFVNAAFEALTGYSRSEVTGRNCRFLRHSKPRQKATDLIREALRTSSCLDVTVRNVRKDGSVMHNHLQLLPVRTASGELYRYIGILSDISNALGSERQIKELQRDLRNAHQQLTDLTRHDPLTGLYNRTHFNEMLQRDWQLAARESKYLCAVLINVDLKERHLDPDSQQAVDQCLVATAQALREGFKRGTDVLARFGSQEFIALLFDLTESRAALITTTICAALRDRIMTDSLSAACTGAIVNAGVASLIPQPGMHPADLLKAAEFALLHARHTVPQGVSRYSELNGPPTS